MPQLMTPKSRIPNIEVPLIEGGTFNMAEASKHLQSLMLL